MTANGSGLTSAATEDKAQEIDRRRGSIKPKDSAAAGGDGLFPTHDQTWRLG